MSDLISNLNKIYNVKLQLKDVLGTSSDIFEDYPSYVAAAIAGGGGSGSGDGSFYSNDFTLTPLDGINNLIEFGDGTYAYGISKQIFTQETPTSAYFDLIPSSLNVSKDSNLNAYMMRDMSFVLNSYSYNSVYNSGSGDVSTITSSNVPATDEFFTARTSFKFNFDKFASPTVRNGVTYTGPFYADGINSNVTLVSDASSIGNSFVEYVTTNDNEPNAIVRNSIDSTVFGTYTIIPMKHDSTYQAVSQYNMTALNGPLKEYAQDADGFTSGKVFGETLNHKIFDVVLSRTSYQAGFKDGKYDTVLVDIANYVGEVQMPRMLNQSYVGTISTKFEYIPFNDSYTYTLPNIASNTGLNYSNIMLDTSDGYKKVNLCEDLNGTTPQYISPKIEAVTHNQGEEDEYTTYIVHELGVLSPYCSVLGSRTPQYMIRNNNEYLMDNFVVQIDAKTWKVNVGPQVSNPGIDYDNSSNYYIEDGEAQIYLMDTAIDNPTDYDATYYCVASCTEEDDGNEGVEIVYPDPYAPGRTWLPYTSAGFTVEEVFGGVGSLPIIIYAINIKNGIVSESSCEAIFESYNPDSELPENWIFDQDVDASETEYTFSFDSSTKDIIEQGTSESPVYLGTINAPDGETIDIKGYYDNGYWYVGDVDNYNIIDWTNGRQASDSDTIVLYSFENSEDSSVYDDLLMALVLEGNGDLTGEVTIYVLNNYTSEMQTEEFSIGYNEVEDEGGEEVPEGE